MPVGTRSRVRELIKAEELVKLLQDNALNKRCKPLHQNKLTAIKTLLNKCLPDIKAVEITGEAGGAINLDIEVRFVDTVKKLEQEDKNE